MGWPYPQIVIVPNLCEEDGTKIGSARGTASEYLVGTYRKRGVAGGELIKRLIEVGGEPTVLHSDGGPICPAQGLRIRVGIDWFEADRGGEGTAPEAPREGRGKAEGRGMKAEGSASRCKD